MYKLMIVDDELLMRVGIRSMLDWEEQGFRIIGESGNGKEALELAIQASPDLIITDIKMPVMDGLQLIREAASLLKTCKYVILSNFDELHYVKEALKLGASDYLIKSEITADTLVELLTSMRQKLQADRESLGKAPVIPYDVSQSLSHLKESYFNDLVSGFINEKEAVAKAEELHFRVSSSKLTVIKFIVNHYEDVKKKYVEKGEKLLRFSILNIMEEIIPSKWVKEIVVESSSQYWIIVNTSLEGGSVRTDIERLCGKLLASIKDFMNLSLTAGVSTVVSGFGFIKQASQEAESALQQSFYTGTGKVLFYEDADKAPARKAVDVILNPEQEQEFATVWVSKDEKKAGQFLEGIRAGLETQRADEDSIREKYIRLMETMHTHLSGASQRSRSAYTEQSPYKTVLKGECWEDIHRGVLAHIGYCFQADSQSLQDCTYSDLAVDIINKYYAEDISLQSIANQINVNPSYLSRMFKQERGENFISYLTRVRIERAKAYLMSGKLMVYEVADKVGYHNYTYFSKIFKKSVGVTPEEYREQQQSLTSP
ncbi:two-component system response regulator YesN [Paenibacillus phyllosphaerae]|uniref:Two-component system response regulator YesN n=1 Tax=Paenibacillus phyllosphaerae TaxID=274593 RepID=A0A7W5ASJ8_9BACL|nr:helix-turn-helix domain-containing protein [Paenibacillus phyllosphaerae]MBB3107990.1 two-component system response regulator YesN [Paenibacillus phyllosphaerae]